ncbi:hypothetical protein F2Q70_00018774 [Brassica cretica]|uniref:Uncharacterized protein n=1 Tax=Brassica cretica TaxID=69181 RepID=A0A8S9HVU9_BRACR|nr:hypothetical protein F2Q70_00018774 [Brassica cretica]
MENKWFPKGGSAALPMFSDTARESPPPVPPDLPDSGLSLIAFPPLSPTEPKVMNDAQPITTIFSTFPLELPVTPKEGFTVDNSRSNFTVHFEGFKVLAPKKSSPIFTNPAGGLARKQSISSASYNTAHKVQDRRKTRFVPLFDRSGPSAEGASSSHVAGASQADPARIISNLPPAQGPDPAKNININVSPTDAPIGVSTDVPTDAPPIGSSEIHELPENTITDSSPVASWVPVGTTPSNAITLVNLDPRVPVAEVVKSTALSLQQKGGLDQTSNRFSCLENIQTDQNLCNMSRDVSVDEGSSPAVVHPNGNSNGHSPGCHSPDSGVLVSDISFGTFGSELLFSDSGDLLPPFQQGLIIGLQATVMPPSSVVIEECHKDPGFLNYVRRFKIIYLSKHKQH